MVSGLPTSGSDFAKSWANWGNCWSRGTLDLGSLVIWSSMRVQRRSMAVMALAALMVLSMLARMSTVWIFLARAEMSRSVGSSGGLAAAMTALMPPAGFF